MMIECKICGTMFETDDRRFKCCSAKCSRINRLQHCKRYYREHKEDQLQKIKKWKQEHYTHEPNRTPHFCKICGEPIRWTSTKHPTRHDECIINEIIKRINSGNRMTDAQYQQLQCLGYDLGSFAEDYRKVLKHYPGVAWNAKRNPKRTK